MAEKIALEIELGTSKAVKNLGDLEKATQKVNQSMSQKGPQTLEQRLDSLNKEVKEAPVNIRAMNKQIQEYQALALEAGRTSPVGKAALQEAANLKDRYIDIQNEVNRLANDGVKLQAALDFGASVVAGYTAFQSALALAGVESEELQKTLVKLQAATSLLVSIETIRKNLEKESTLILVSKNLVQEISNKLTVAATAITKALGLSVDTTSVAFKGLRGAILATGIGALVIGIGALVANFDELKDLLSSTTDSQKKYNDAAKQAIDNIGEELSASNKLQRTLKDESITREDKVKAVKQLQDEYPNLLSNIDAEKTSIEDINKALKLNTQLVRLKAQQDALQSLRAEEYKEILKAQVDAQTGVNKGLVSYFTSLATGVDEQQVANAETLNSIEANKESISVLDQLEQEIQAQIKALEELGATDGEMTEAEKKKAEDRLKRLEDEKKAYEESKIAFEKWLESENNATMQRLENLKKVKTEAISVRDSLKDLTQEIMMLEDETDLVIEDLGVSEKTAKRKAEIRINGIANSIEKEKQMKLQQLEWDKETELQELQLSGELTNDLKAQIELDYQRRRQKIIEDSNKQVYAINTEYVMAGINLVQGSLTAIAQLNEAFAGEDEKSQKQAFERSKKIQIAQALMSSAQGIVNILSAVSTIPQPFDTIYKAAQIGILGASTVAQVQKIRNQKFEGSGSATIDTPNLGAGGGQAPALQPANTSLLVPQQDNRVYVTETDITGTQNQVAVIQGMGSF